MKRLQISLEPELDNELEREARQRGISKAEVVRRCLRKGIEPAKPWPKDDPFYELIGSVSGGPPHNTSERVDEIVYGPKTKWPS